MRAKLSFFDALALNFARMWPLGILPKAPGTWGSAASVLLAVPLFLPFSLPARLAVLAAAVLLGTLASTRAEKLLGAKDPSSVVIDELAGQWTALLFVPGPDPVLLAAAFVLFRLLDIAKPWPIRVLDKKLPSGVGIMADDLLAGLIAALALLPFV